MEFGTFSSPESSSSSEKKNDDTESDGKNKKKSSKNAATLGGILAEKTINEAPPQPPASESFWEKLTKKTSEPPKKETNILDADAELPGVDVADQGSDAAESSEMSNSENGEIARSLHEYTELRLDSAAGELHELPLDSPAAAETAANVALLQAMQENLSAAPQNPEAAIEAAEGEVTTELQEISSVEDPNEVEATSEAAEAEADDYPYAALQSSGTGGGQPPTSPMGAAGSGNNLPPNPLLYTQQQPAPSPNTIGAPSSSFESDYSKQSEVRGLLVGGVIGYFIGRRRGRIKTERKLMLLQKKLEKRVESLQQTINAKEQSIRALAREKISAVVDGKDRQKIVEQLVTSRAVVERNNSAKVSPAEAAARSMRLAAPESQSKFKTEQIGRILVETPLAGAAVATGVERRSTSQRTSKKIENFSHEDLMQAAEKIEIQGVSLKELRETNRIDERGLRRVVAEYFEGGNVNAVFTQEMIEKDLQFEKDPRMRSATGRTMYASGGASVASGSQNQILSDSNDQTSAAAGGQTIPGPMPSEERVKAIKQKQMTTVGGLALVVLVILIGVILVLR